MVLWSDFAKCIKKINKSGGELELFIKIPQGVTIDGFEGSLKLGKGNVLEETMGKNPSVNVGSFDVVKDDGFAKVEYSGLDVLFSIDSFHFTTKTEMRFSEIDSRLVAGEQEIKDLQASINVIQDTFNNSVKRLRENFKTDLKNQQMLLDDFKKVVVSTGKQISELANTGNKMRIDLFNSLDKRLKKVEVEVGIPGTTRGGKNGRKKKKTATKKKSG